MTDELLSEQGLNTEILHDLLSDNVPKRRMAKELGVTVASLNKTIKELSEGQGLLLKYRELQHLQLTNLQARILECMTPDKIEAASLVELATVFRILKDKELVVQGKASNITGLVGYLVQLEKEELQKLTPVDVTHTDYVIDAEETDDNTDDIPNL